MYTNFIQNQVSLKRKSAYSAHFSQSQVFNGDIFGYLQTCTNLQKDIAGLFLDYRYAKNIKLTNSFISSQINCSTKTVTRCTNKFHDDGFISKHQENPYAPNHFVFNGKAQRGKHAYNFWINSLSEENRELYITHGIRIDHNKKIIFRTENVPHNNNIYINYNYINKPIPSARVRTREEDGVPGFKTLESKKRRDRYEQGVKMLTQEQKRWIVSRSSTPMVKDLLSHPKIKPALITKPMETLKELLSLDDREQLKLIPFTDEALQYAIDYVEPIMSGKKSLKKAVVDRMGWLMSMLTAYSKKNNIEPDWRWYFELCEIIGQEPLKKDEAPKPLTVKPVEVARTGAYKIWQSPVQPPLVERISKLRADISGLEYNVSEMLSGKHVDDPGYAFRKILLPAWQENIVEKKKELTILEMELNSGELAIS